MGVAIEERMLSGLDGLARATIDVVDGVGSGGKHDEIVAVAHVGMSGVERIYLVGG